MEPDANGYPGYQTASKKLPAVKPDYQAVEAVVETGNWSTASPSVIEWIDDSRDALGLWRTATRKHSHLRVQPADLTIENAYGSVTNARAFKNLATLAALKVQSTADKDESWEWLRALFRYSRHIGMYSSTIDRISGSAIHSSVSEQILRWADGPTVGKQDIQTALTSLRKDFEMTAQPSVAVGVHYYSTLDELSRWSEMREAHKTVIGEFDSRGILDQIEHIVGSVSFPYIPGPVESFVKNEPELTRRLLQHQVANLLKFADRPAPECPPLLPGKVALFDDSSVEPGELMSKEAFMKAVDRSPVATMFLFNSRALGAPTELTRQVILETILAAHLFRHQNGGFPNRLDESVDSGILKQVPIDPLSPTRSHLGYERETGSLNRAKVWSVGRNGSDEKGSFEHIPGLGAADLGYSFGANRE